jgi:hypothetical protein
VGRIGSFAWQLLAKNENAIVHLLAKETKLRCFTTSLQSYVQLWLLVIGYWLVPIGCCLLSIVYCLLAIGYWLLSSYGYWLLAIGHTLEARASKKHQGTRPPISKKNRGRVTARA